MKRLVALMLVLAIAFSATPAFAAFGEKGASATAVEKASDEAIFHRVTDWFATRGKSPEEAKAIIAERKAKRAADRAQKEALRAQKQAMKKQKELQAQMKKSQEEMKKKWAK
jgi:hypothetical protein